MSRVNIYFNQDDNNKNQPDGISFENVEVSINNFGWLVLNKLISGELVAGFMPSAVKFFTIGNDDHDDLYELLVFDLLRGKGVN